MGQEITKTIENQPGPKEKVHSPKNTSQTSAPSETMNEKVESDRYPSLGTSVDGMVNDKTENFSQEGSQQLPSFDLQLQKSSIDRFYSLQGHIAEVKEMNSEIMEKITLLEKRSAERKQQRALNRMKNAKTSTTVTNAPEQSAMGTWNQKPILQEITNDMEPSSEDIVKPGSTDATANKGFKYKDPCDPSRMTSDTGVLEGSLEVDKCVKSLGLKPCCRVMKDDDASNITDCFDSSALKFKDEKDEVFDNVDTGTCINSPEIKSSDVESAESKGEDLDTKALKSCTSNNEYIQSTSKILQVEIPHDLEVSDDKWQGEKPDYAIKIKDSTIKKKDLKENLNLAENSQMVQVPSSDTEAFGPKITEVGEEKKSTVEKRLSKDLDNSEEKVSEESVNKPDMKGFTSTFELTMTQKEYNSMLRRLKTIDTQDNRLVVQFNLMPNAGSIYTSSKPNEIQLNSCRRASDTNPSGQYTSQKQVEGTSELDTHERVRQQKFRSNTKRSCVWKTEPTKMDQVPVNTYKLESLKTEPKVLSVEPESKQKDKDLELLEMKKAKSLESVKDASGIKETENLDFLEGQSVDKPAPSEAAVMQLLLPAMKQIGVPCEIEGDSLKLDDLGCKFDVKTGKLKIDIATGFKGGVEEAKTVIEQYGQEIDESEMEQLKSGKKILEVLTGMCSDEGIDLPEAFHMFQDVLINGILKQLLGEENARIMKTLSDVVSQMMKAVEQATSVATHSSSQGGDQSAFFTKSQPSKPQDHQDSGNLFQQPEVRPKQERARLKTDEENVRTDAKESLTEDCKNKHDIFKTELVTRAKVKDQAFFTAGADVDEKEEVVWIDEANWTDAANMELVKGSACRAIREKGMDTIICLDVSSSMRGEAWKQAMAFIRGFIECIQTTTLTDDVFEHVALVTFGSETKVHQHMTCDYFEFLRKLDNLKPGGPSPMVAGIFMCLAAVRGAGSVFCANGFKIHPRVFLVTDGRATPGGMISGPDCCSPYEMLSTYSSVQNLVGSITMEHHWTVHPVPVGNFDLTLLERLADDTKGKITSPDDWRRVSRTMRNLLLATKVRARKMKVDSVPLPVILPVIADYELSMDDYSEITKFLDTCERLSDDEDSDDEDSNLPPPGTRVRRTKKLADGDDACNLGTIVKRFSGGDIAVLWDNKSKDAEVEKIKFNSGSGNNEVKITDEPRVMKKDEMIAVGCTVKRGQDWHYTDQDGGAGNLGTVIQVRDNGILQIRWRNGHTNSYRYGSDGKFDVEVVSPVSSRHKHVTHHVEGAVCGSLKSLASITMDSDKGSDNSISTDESGMTMVERMNRLNAKMSNMNMKNTTIDTSDISENSKIRTQSKSRDNDDVEKQENLTDEVETDKSDIGHCQLGGNENTGAKPKHSLLQLRHNSVSDDEKKSVTVLQCNIEVEKQVKEKKPFFDNLSSPKTVLQEQTVTKTASLKVPGNSHHIQDDEKLGVQKIPLKYEETADNSSFLSSGTTEQKDEVEVNTSIGCPKNRLLPSNYELPGISENTNKDGSRRTASVTWFWNESGEWRPYPADVKEKIEKSFQSKKPSVLIKVDSKVCRVVFARMEQIDINTKTATKVQRQSSS